MDIHTTEEEMMENLWKKWHSIRQQICCSLQSIPEQEI